jgi:glycosyltransferase involved in cell wall biosynthesis
MKLISIVTPCYNEEQNVEELRAQIVQVMSEMPEYEFEHIYIDNASTDGTVPILRRLAAADPRVKVILNARNFGHIRSPFHGILQARGDAVICMSSDLQDPPIMIKEFIKRWEEGCKAVMGVKSRSEETRLLFVLRRLYYRALRKLSDIPLVENFTGFALYDQEVVKILRKIDDPYPYIRGLIPDLGITPVARVEFLQPTRKRGITKNNLYTLYDMAMLGFVYNTRKPLRLATVVGFLTAATSLLAALFYLVYKLIHWSSFELGLAPLVVGLFFFGGIQLFFLGIVAEYVGAIYTQVLHRPLVIEKERINFGPEGE